MIDPVTEQLISSLAQPRRHDDSSRVYATTTPTEWQEPAGTVELSDAALAENTVTGRSGIRSELVARIRAEVAAGTYLTDEKLEIALDRMRRGLPEAAA